MSRATHRQEARKRPAAGRKKKGARGASRRLAAFCSVALLAAFLALGFAGSFFLHHPRKWIESRLENWPAFVTAPLVCFGGPFGDFLDAVGLAGHDAVYEYDEAAPSGSIIFAGVPVRNGAPAPDDITILDRGDFLIGWSPSLRHPVWVAYHVPERFAYNSGARPPFEKDFSAKGSPHPNSYLRSGYDRGHMAPNHAITTRFGSEAQRLTFRMSNIAPQSPLLNRGVWREVERRIADLWTGSYGEIWVVVGAVPSETGETIGSTGIDVPSAFWQVVVAQKGLDVRALALIYPQHPPEGLWPARGLVSIDELEELTGLDFLPALPEFIQAPLEAELPSRLWPVGLWGALRQFAFHFNH